MDEVVIKYDTSHVYKLEHLCWRSEKGAMDAGTRAHALSQPSGLWSTLL